LPIRLDQCLQTAAAELVGLHLVVMIVYILPCVNAFSSHIFTAVGRCAVGRCAVQYAAT